MTIKHQKAKTPHFPATPKLAKLKPIDETRGTNNKPGKQMPARKKGKRG